MSKQLAVSASLSIMAMAFYVLFGSESAREPLGAPAVSIEAPALPAPRVSLKAAELLR